MKKFISRSVFWELQLIQISLNFQTPCCNLKLSGAGAKMCETFFNYFYFAMNYAILKSKNACFYVFMLSCMFNENTKFNKNKMGSKMVILHTVLEGWTLHLFSSYKDCKSKVKLWWVWAQKINKSGIFVTFVLSERNLLSCVLSQCIANWINFKSIYTFTYQRTTLLLLVLKSTNPLSLSLMTSLV